MSVLLSASASVASAAVFGGENISKLPSPTHARLHPSICIFGDSHATQAQGQHQARATQYLSSDFLVSVATQANSYQATATAAEPASNIAQRSEARYYDTNPLQSKVDAQGIAALTPVEKKTYTYTSLIVPVIQSTVTLSNKAEREYWKQVSKENLPIRRLDKAHDWGKDKSGRDISTYTIDEFEARKLKQAQLAALTLLHRRFLAKRARDGAATSSEDVEQEKTRRKEMATLKKDLYGEIAGSLANEPEWDDVVPIPHDEPEDALARIAYPDEYAEGRALASKLSN